MVDGIETKAPVTPEAMQVMLLHEIAGRLRAIQEHLNDTVAEGGLDLPTVAVGGEPVEVRLGKWLAVTITNDGASGVYVYYQRKKPSTLDSALASGETITLDQKKKMDRSLWFVCAAGGTATIRMWVQY